MTSQSGSESSAACLLRFRGEFLDDGLHELHELYELHKETINLRLPGN